MHNVGCMIEDLPRGQVVEGEHLTSKISHLK